MDRSLKVKGLVVIALPLAILLSALVWIGLAAMGQQAAEDQVRLTLLVQSDLQTLEALLFRAAAEAGARSPATRDATAARLSTLAARVPRIVSNVAASMEERGQSERLLRLQPVAIEALHDLREQVRAAPAGVSDRSQTMEIGRTLAYLHRELDGLRERESDLLAERSSRADAAWERNMLLTGLAIVLGLLGSLAAVVLFSRSIVVRVGALELNARRLARGEPLKTLPADADEIGRLGVALGRASALLAERQGRLEELVGRLFQVQEDERRRVAHELHDGLAQVAAAAHQHLQAFAERYPPDGPAARAALDRGLDLAQRAVRETRAAIAGLRPTVLDDFGLARALEIELDKLAEDGREVTFLDRLTTERSSASAETMLFRIAQEAVANIRKHAGPAARVHVALDRIDDFVRLTVRDDGRGFDLARPSTVGRRPGERIGLEAIRERATLAGGRMKLESAPGSGTVLVVEIPR